MEYTDDKMPLGGGTLANRQHSHQHPHTLSQEGRPHAPGSSRGPNAIEVLKYPVEYQYKPITQCAKSGRYDESY